MIGVSENKMIDYSLLRPAIQTSVTGFVQAIKAYENGTEEVKYSCYIKINLFLKFILIYYFLLLFIIT